MSPRDTSASPKIGATLMSECVLLKAVGVAGCSPISVAQRPQLPSPTTKQSVYQAGQGSHQQMGGTQEPAATRARAGPVRAISSDDKVLLDVSGIKHMAFYHSTSCLFLGSVSDFFVGHWLASYHSTSCLLGALCLIFAGGVA